MAQLTSQQLTTLLTEMQTDPRGLGYAPYLALTQQPQLTDLLTWSRDGVTPCPDNGIIGQNGVITAATNASPIVITSANHGLSTGDSVYITGVLGNTAANNVPLNSDGIYTSPPNEAWIVTKVNANTFSLNTSTGNGAYTSGGTWNWCITTLANSTALFNRTISVASVIAQISAADAASATSLTGTQAVILPAWLNPTGSVMLTDQSGTETLAAGWLALLTPAGTNSHKAVKALETRFGNRGEQVLNMAGYVVTQSDVLAAINGVYS